MKKLFSLLLVFAMLLALCACTATENPGDSTAESTLETVLDPAVDSDFLAGYGFGDITPEKGAPLLGYGNDSTRLTTGFKSYLYSMCLAVQDNKGTTAMLISVDSAALSESICNTIKAKIQTETGVPASNIILSAIHQHSTPNYSSSSAYSAEVSASALKYKDVLVNGTVQAAVDAYADLAPAEMYVTSIETESLNFVRNYVCNDGTYFGDNYGSSASGIKDHESVADATLQLLKFVRGGGKKDIIAANFQGHPHMGASSSDTNAHSDTVGVFRDTLADELDCNVIYFSGAGGNINMTSRIKEENVYTSMYTHGARLAEYAVEAEGTYKKVETGLVQVQTSTKLYNTDKSQEALYEQAVAFMKIWNEQGIKAAQAAIKTDEYKDVFHSIYHAKYVVIKHDLPSKRSLSLYAISFGDVAFTGAPCEQFDTNGDEIKSGSPFEMTFITTQTNGCDGYIPSIIGYTNGGYSTDITRYAPGTGEQVAQDFVTMLTQMHDAG